MSRLDEREDGTRGLVVIDGHGMSADDAAWALIADAAERGLSLPGLSSSCALKLERVMSAGDRAAGLQPRALPQPRRQPS